MSASTSTTSETLVVSIEQTGEATQSQANCWLLDVEAINAQAEQEEEERKDERRRRLREQIEASRC